MLGKKRNKTNNNPSIIPFIKHKNLSESNSINSSKSIEEQEDLSKELFNMHQSHSIIPQSTIISNKPLWISDVSHSFKKIFPNPIENKDFEQINDLMQIDKSSESFDNNEYPYYYTIKKIMYAFGDCYENNHDTVLYMHDFIKTFIVNLTKIFNECDFKKIIDHFFSYEYEKLHNYKKLKFKNNIITGDNDSNTGEDIKFNCNNNNEMNFIENNILCDDDEDGDSFNLGKEKKHHSNNSHINYKDNNDIDDKDENYTENILFQSERTEKMDTNKYLEYNACRQHGFVTKGKKIFMEYLQSILQKSFPNEFKDYNNIELLAFILKESIKKIIIESIKDKHPQHKLFVLNYPLITEDIGPYCNEENMKLVEFLNDFHSNVSMIKEFKKRHVNDKKSSNKNVKVKKGDDGEGILIIIKRIALVENKEEADLYKNKRIAEMHALNALLILKDKYVLLKNRKSYTGKKANNDKTEFKFIHSNQVEISIAELLEFLSIDNYYEYFLVKEFITSINVKEIKSIELINRITQINKMNNKKLTQKFLIWLQMSNDEKIKFIQDFEKLIKTSSSSNTFLNNNNNNNEDIEKNNSKFEGKAKFNSPNEEENS